MACPLLYEQSEQGANKIGMEAGAIEMLSEFKGRYDRSGKGCCPDCWAQRQK